MQEFIITNASGQQFEISPAMSFRDDGTMYSTGGWFASLFINNGSGTGIWFASKDQAVAYCMGVSCD